MIGGTPCNEMRWQWGAPVPEVLPMPDIALPFTCDPSNMAWLTGHDGLAEVPRKLLVKP